MIPVNPTAMGRQASGAVVLSQQRSIDQPLPVPLPLTSIGAIQYTLLVGRRHSPGDQGGSRTGAERPRGRTRRRRSPAWWSPRPSPPDGSAISRAPTRGLAAVDQVVVIVPRERQAWGCRGPRQQRRAPPVAPREDAAAGEESIASGRSGGLCAWCGDGDGRGA
jgi:hypothetical protein